MRIWLACGVVVAVAASGVAARAQGTAEPRAILGDAATLRDFMIQNVCLDATGAVLRGVAPIDGNPGCVAQRDLRPGERLPYHKHDQPFPGQRAELPTGYQRHDSFPVTTAGFADAVEHSFDFGTGEGRRFGVFDAGSDGGDLAILSPGTVAIGVTEDGGAGFQLFVGECQGTVDAAALSHAWIVAQYDPARPMPLQGETIARLNDLKTGQQDSCPRRFNAAYTAWRVTPFAYRTGSGQGAPLTLTTLLSEHYGGGMPATADHVERFYFTRELGGTRWERWQNVKGNAIAGPEKIAELAAAFTATGRCSAPTPPGGGATMLLIDCREWTLMAPPADPAGDPPGFFLRALQQRGRAPAFLAAPASK